MSKESITIPRQLFENLLEDAMELQGERHWWHDEPRCGYQKLYEELSVRINEGVALRDVNEPDAAPRKLAVKGK